MAHKGSKPMRMAKIEMLEGQLNRFVMFDDKISQDMFNQLKKMVNKAKALGSKKWIDLMLTECLMRAYTPMNHNVVALIHQDPTYKRLTSDDVLGMIINHEMYIEEANHIKNPYKGVSTTKKQEIALKAIKKSKNNHVVVERLSEEEEEEEDSSECDAKEMALFMRKFKKFSKGDKKFNTKLTTKRICYIVVSMVLSLLIALLSVGMMMMKRRISSTRRTRATKRVISPIRRSPMAKLTLVKNGIPMMKAPTPIMTLWQPLLQREQLLQGSLSSQSSIKRNTLAPWQRRASIR
jgi:hypothetical protein